MSRSHNRLIATISTAALLATAGIAQAQGRCGGSYTIEPGDTLFSISQRCGVSLSLIYDLNPGINARALAVGSSVTLADDGSSAPRDDARRSARRDRPDRYEVRSGDTAYSIAQAFGISLMELLNQNPDLEPLSMAVGEALNIPTGDRSAGIRIQPQSGAPGSQVTVRATNLRPYDYVTIGVGPAASEWQAITQAQADGQGRVEASVRVPRRYDPGDRLIFVVDTDRGQTLKSLDFEVTARAGDDDRRMALEGRVREGVECPILRTPDGDTYSLVSEDIAFTPGEYVEIEGTRAEMSFCQQGRATIDVSDLRETRPPQDGRDGDGGGGDADGHLTRAELRGAWKYDDGACARPNFDVTRSPGGYLQVETSVNGSARTGDVRTGSNARFHFDQTGGVVTLAELGPGRIRLQSDEPMTLGGRNIGGDGAVFVKC